MFLYRPASGKTLSGHPNTDFRHKHKNIIYWCFRWESVREGRVDLHLSSVINKLLTLPHLFGGQKLSISFCLVSSLSLCFASCCTDEARFLFLSLNSKNTSLSSHRKGESLEWKRHCENRQTWKWCIIKGGGEGGVAGRTECGDKEIMKHLQRVQREPKSTSSRHSERAQQGW